MACPPLVEPSAPELGAHLRGVGAELAEAAELFVDVCSRAEVHRPDEVVEAVLGEVARPVALEEGHLVEARLLHDVAYLADVGLVFAIRAVLVLNLHHYYRSAVLYRQRGELLAHLLLEQAHALHEIGVLLAQADVFLLQQPPRQAAHLPLRTHVRTGAHDDIHAVTLCRSAELGHVVVAGEVKFAFPLLVDVPEHVHADGVHTQCLAHPYAVFPIGPRDAGIVKLGRLHHEGLAVKKECSLAHGEIAGGRCRHERHA